MNTATLQIARVLFGLGVVVASQGYWESQAAIAKYSKEPFLLRGERLAIASCFPGGFAGRHVMDLGCGTGRVAYLLRKMGADVVGVDASRHMIDKARNRFPQIDFRVGNALSIEFDDAAFDAVFFAYNGLDLLHPKENRTRCIQEVRRILKTDGLFVFSSHNLAALLFGFPRSDGGRGWQHRIRHVLDGSAFKEECYLPDPYEPCLVYHAWPRRVVSELKVQGFDLVDLFPNDHRLPVFQQRRRSHWLTELSEPFPHYVFRKSRAIEGR